MKQIPNLFTLLNLVCGCIAIIYIFKDDGFLFTSKAGTFSMGLIVAGVYIFLAAVVDFLDGFVARLFNATSDMGAQLDSLADAVTFGVAPGMIMYRLLQLALTKTELPRIIYGTCCRHCSFPAARCGVWLSLIWIKNKPIILKGYLRLQLV
ncbi:CDP-alcohol phosphatidyltransferase family protein [Niabella sp. W65]|nr:CDP-alcohol phosphatidyltransferase family protein [Niabella sp. W65]MCH7365945.1 CDP-alcohol phosphatidyltransferase family protein [Niabella sp. W65]ULT41685.1 CDP-alcohol phosphatidyltransferase family protein [Niabella sp. I65]